MLVALIVATILFVFFPNPVVVLILMLALAPEILLLDLIVLFLKELLRK